MKISGHPMPANTGRTEDKLFRRLDCAVINHLHARIDQEWEIAQALDQPKDALPSFGSVRALFSEGGDIYPGAGFKEKTHIQICIRNSNCIKGFFDPRKSSAKWPMP